MSSCRRRDTELSVGTINNRRHAAASPDSSPENFALTAAYCRKHIAPERLWGFMQTPWRPTIPEFRERLIQAAEQVGQVIAELSAIKQKAS